MWVKICSYMKCVRAHAHIQKAHTYTNLSGVDECTLFEMVHIHPTVSQQFAKSAGNITITNGFDDLCMYCIPYIPKR